MFIELFRFNCESQSAAHVVKLLLLIHSQKMRDRLAGQWLRECGGEEGGAGGGARHRTVRTTAVRYFG